MVLRNLSRLPLAGAFLFILGCGVPTGELNGRVVFGKDPLQGGTLVFEYSDGQSATVTVKTDGSFSVSNLPVGSANVGVSPPAAPKMNAAIQAKMKAPKGMEGKENYYGMNKAVKIKEKYKTASSSGFKVVIKAGKNDDVTFTVD